MRVIGLLSGTSADGIDVVLCELDGAPPNLSAHIIDGMTVPYDEALRARILRACELGGATIDEVARLNVDVGEAFADAVMQLLAQTGGTADLIGSHGQTVWHDVDVAGKVRATLQIGESSVIAERTGITTVANFRARDVALGGQGAPLTSYADWVLLRREQGWRAVQNFGGIGNVTLLPPKDDTKSQPLAFDTGPANVLIDSAVTDFTDGAQTYDRDGAMAQAGHVDGAWLESLMEHDYFARPIPKTTGRELFSAAYARELCYVGLARGLSLADIVATLTALTVTSVADAYQRFVSQPLADVVVGGGGRNNPALMSMLRKALAPTQVLTHEDIGLDSDYKEGLVFALLAYETWHNRVGTLPSMTGARKASVLGHITFGANADNLLRQTWG